MRPILTALLFLHCLFVNGQVQQLDVTKNSGELLNIITQEIKRTHVTANFPVRDLFSTGDARRQYILNYQAQLKAAYLDSGIANDVLMNANVEKLASYGNSALTRFKSVSGGKYVDRLIAPVLGSGLLYYAKDTVESLLALPQNVQTLSAMAIDALSVLKKNGFDYIGKSKADVINKIEELKNSLPFDEMNDFIFPSIEAKCMAYIENTPGQIVLSTNRRIDKVFSQELTSIRTTAFNVSKAAFAELGKGMKILSDNEAAVNSIVDKITSDIRARKTEIDKVEHDIYVDAQNKVFDFAKQALHTQLVAQNLLVTNVLNSYIKEGMKIVDRIDEFKTTASKVFDGSYLKDFKSQLDILKTPTLSGVVTFASNSIDAVGEIGGTLSKFGIINAAAAKSVSKFVVGAKLAIGIATALLPPNPIGILGALGGLGGLFGGGGPSIEEQIFQEMQKGFDHINQRLDEIENKINAINQTIQVMYRDIMKSLQLVTNQLNVIEQKIDLVLQMESFPIYQDYNLVDVMISNKINNATGLDLYSRWYGNNPANNTALAALNTFIATTANLQEVVRADFTKQQTRRSYAMIADQEIKSFNATRDLFIKFNPDIKDNSIRQNLLAVPAQRNTANGVLNGVEVVNGKSYFDFGLATNNYFNSIFLTHLTDQYLTLHPFYLLSKKGASNYEPASSLKELIDNQETVADKIEPSRKRLHNLLTYVNYAIVQQCLLAGHTMMQDLNAALFSDPANYNESIAVLQTNDILRKNLCVYLLGAKVEYGDKDSLYAWIANIKSGRDKIPDLNALLKHGAGRLKFALGGNAADSALYLQYTLPASNDVIFSMSVPDVSIVKNQEMIYSDNLYDLIDCKQRIINALIDMSFFQNIPDDFKDQYKKVLLNVNK